MGKTQNIFFVPCRSAREREILEQTVRNEVEFDELDDPTNTLPTHYLWGERKSESEGTWNKIRKNDYLLFYSKISDRDEDYRYVLAAKVQDSKEDAELASTLWGSGTDSDELRELLIYLETPREIDIAAETLSEYGAMGDVSHFRRMDPEAVVNIRERYGSINRFVEAHESGRVEMQPLENPEINDSLFSELSDQLESKGQIVLYGPPGTGKTFHATRFAKAWLNERNGSATKRHYYQVTFHPSFTYEDFIEGLSITTERRPDGKSDISYEIQPGIFKQICEDATEEYDTTVESDEKPDAFVLVIDEMNRANLAEVFGELITLLEYDKRGMEVSLAHSDGDMKFTVPPNLFIIGTMNTSDQSIALIDSAIRRRFRFIQLGPDYAYLKNVYGFETDHRDYQSLEFERQLQLSSIGALKSLNDRILDASELDKGKQIGHSYLLGNGEQQRLSKSELVNVWKHEILPLLEEYYFGDFTRIRNEVFAGVNDQLTHPSRPEFRKFTEHELEKTLRQLAEFDPTG